MYYLVDTNIILNDYKSVIKISNKKKNTIVLTETILKELDKFKIGNESINYNARAFIKLLNDSEAKYKNNILSVNCDEFYLIVLKDIEGEFDNNDDKIIQTAISVFTEDNLVFISNDILFRTKVLLHGYKAQPFKSDIHSPNVEFKFYTFYNDEFLNKEYFTQDELEKLLNSKIENNISVIEIDEYNGNKNLLIRETSSMFRKLDLKKDINIFGIKQRNLEQRLFLELALSDVDILVVDAIAGTGKTLLSLLSAIRLIELGQYDKITYIRKTIISGDKQDEIGFLPGTSTQKIAPYTYPMKDNLEIIVKSRDKKKKNWSADELDKVIKEFENKYNINYEYMGHMRGRTLSGIVILEEAQNFSIKDLTLLLSRIAEGSKVFIIGSTKQIDNPYVNKYTNALTFMLNNCGDSFNGLKIRGLKMSKVERGKITEWIEEVTK